MPCDTVQDRGAPASAATEARITISITPTIERDLERRGVFPDLRRRTAPGVPKWRIGFHEVSIERAREILACIDALGYRRQDWPRGTRTAYSALEKMIRRQISERTARRDPAGNSDGNEAKNFADRWLARFAVGDRVLCTSLDVRGDEASIVGGYQLYRVANGCNGRISYRCGYLIELRGTCFFAPAHQLLRHDGQRAYLRLAASRPAPARRLLRRH